MRTGPHFTVATWLVIGWATGAVADGPGLPKVADGWSIALAQQAPAIQYPTAIVVAPDGTIFLGQDPMNMPGPVNAPVDSVLMIRPDGSTRVFADKLQSVMGLEWVDGTLYVVHAPYLSSFRDTDGDGVADQRVDLVTGLGPKVPGFNGLNDHIASGVRLGMDGFLYISVGDKGIPQARGTDGKTITSSTGGVVRVRPDGTDLEVVSTGERNPLSVALSDGDDVWTFGNDDDSHLWPNSLTHHIVGGHYGYPYEFRAAPHRALPIVAGQSSGAGAQGVCSNDAGLPPRFRGNLFFADWGLQAVARYEVEPKGATFRLVRREAIVEKGDLADFRPFALAPTSDGSGFWVVDWAYNGWLGVGPSTGRLFRLTYTGSDRPEPAPRTVGTDLAGQLVGLDNPTLAIRARNQRAIARRGAAAVMPLAAKVGDRAGTETSRIHALWALDAVGSPAARGPIRAAISDPNPVVRGQAIRSAGLRHDLEAEPAFAAALKDSEATVRREAAIALGRLPQVKPATRTALYTALQEADPTVAWSIRHAIRSQPIGDGAALFAALADPSRRDSALTLADGWYAPEVVKVLLDAYHVVSKDSGDEIWRARVTAALGALYAKVPAPNGPWFGSDPVAGPRPKATEPWDKASMEAVLQGVAEALRAGNAGIRRQAIIAAINIGPKAIPPLRKSLLDSPGDSDPVNLQALLRYLGEQRDTLAAPGVARVLADSKQPEEVRFAALDALAQMNGPVAINARLQVLYDPGSSEALISRALPPLGRAKLLPSNDLIGFLDHQAAPVRAAALAAFPVDKPLPLPVIESILLHVDDPSPEVRVALANAAGTHRIKSAIPQLVEWASLDGPVRFEAIRALTTMPDRRGLAGYVAALDDRDPALRRAGLAALTAIRAEVAPELTAMASRGAFVGPSASLVERLLSTFRPIMAWRVIGPFPRATGPIFADPRSIDFTLTRTGAEGKTVAWQGRSVDPKTGILALDDLGSPGGNDRAESPREALTAFAVAEIVSAEDRSALLVLDATGPTVVVVDDRPLANFGAGVSNETIRVPLKSGTNRILLRTRQGVGRWSIRVELSDPQAGGISSLAAARSTPIQREGLRAFALKRTGDPRNGELIFHESAGGVGCIRCHSVGGRPATSPGLGPDLAGLALKYDKAEIIRAVLDPSDRIAVGFAATVLAKRDGTIATGIIRAETAETIELQTSDGQILQVATREVSERKTSDASIMPAGLVDGLKPVEFADLIAYLISLKASIGGAARAN